MVSRTRSRFGSTAHMEIVVIAAAVGKPVNQPAVAVIGKDDRLIHRENGIEIAVAKAVRMLGAGLQGHQVHDVHDPDFYVRKMLA